MMSKILLSDPTLRDGNHAIGHKLTAKQIADYCRLADLAKIPIIEVGHGNGLGASSLQLGESATSDFVALTTARENLQNSLLGIHVIPGFATIQKDLKVAVEIGVDVFRIASHCSEADITERHIKYAKDAGKTVYGVLMMSHMLSPELLAEEAAKMESYGAEVIIFMDSSGNYLPQDVTDRVKALRNSISIPVGFHGHNNLGLAVANSIAAVEAGAIVLDACCRGFGAGAGNTQLEALVAVLNRLKYDTGIDFYKLLDLADMAEKEIIPSIPTISSVSIVSGLAGVFSGFLKPVNRIAKEYEIDPRDLFFELGRRKIVAGQEDLIIEVARDLASKTSRG
jgi:4-hydroxy 2-oxovalerate aldolase